MHRKSTKLLREAEEYAAYAMANLTNEDRFLADKLAAHEKPGIAAGLDEFSREIQSLVASYLFPHVSNSDRALIVELLIIRSKVAGSRNVMLNVTAPEDKHRTESKIKHWQLLSAQVKGRIEESGLMAKLTGLQKEILEYVIMETMARSESDPVKAHLGTIQGIDLASEINRNRPH